VIHWIRSLGIAPNDLHQHVLAPYPVELAIEDLLPGTEIQPAVRHRYHHLAPHHLTLEVGICVVLAGSVVPVLTRRLVRGEALQPGLVIVVFLSLEKPTTFVKVDQIYTEITWLFR
jgi:hypothetical protein